MREDAMAKSIYEKDKKRINEQFFKKPNNNNNGNGDEEPKSMSRSGSQNDLASSDKYTN